LGILPEFGQVLVCLQDSFLNRILRIFPVMRDALGDAKKFAIVSLYELLESSNIRILAGVDKIEIIVCACPYFELCCVCRHFRSVVFEEQPLCESHRHLP
jgi:hypothetical protein